MLMVITKDGVPFGESEKKTRSDVPARARSFRFSRDASLRDGTQKQRGNWWRTGREEDVSSGLPSYGVL